MHNRIVCIINWVGLLYLYILYTWKLYSLVECAVSTNPLRRYMLMAAVLFELYLLKGAGENDRGTVNFTDD
jgi:hypothetical protein